MRTAKGLYIHIPFCKSKCAYCAFASYAARKGFVWPYLKALADEAQAYKNFKPQTLYIGGGTPSLLEPGQINYLCDIVEQNFGFKFKEATFECNPESLTEDKLKVLKRCGFTRLSLGAQSMDDKCLKAIGRAHDKKTFLSAFKLAQKYFDNLSLDLIAALPGQTLFSFKTGLKDAAALGAKHISLYGLQVEEGTKLFKSGFAPDDNLCRAMLEYAADYLAGCGYAQYEISNFSQKGFESVHNINYWRGGEYLGLGSSAASYLKGARRCNADDFKQYIKGRRIAESEKLTGKAKLGESIILGLRMIEGLKLTKQMRRYFGKEIAALCARGLLLRKGENIRFTDEGKYFANEAWRHFVEPFE